eukprot:CAMPEP_0114252620 /NCGR_PEP_ID=MMETSP0058-20121206/15935_1 /TAXON_ID=36894 /ORGANISM="Pyramimonas parkeae, CCMP726" /LENGTH=118 /DNA_ID=CAMNT_0001366569 /DNA_START=601 /DNA_END=957 /DNA_ORIENTATION=+
MTTTITMLTMLCINSILQISFFCNLRQQILAGWTARRVQGCTVAPQTLIRGYGGVPSEPMRVLNQEAHPARAQNTGASPQNFRASVLQAVDWAIGKAARLGKHTCPTTTEASVSFTGV